MGNKKRVQREKTGLIMKGRNYMDLAFDREWGNITLVKTFFEEFTLSKMKEAEDIHKVGITVSELLENAVKYSTKNGIRIVIKSEKLDKIVRIKVLNYTSDYHINNIKTRLKEMKTMDSLDFYLYRMRESVKDKNAPPGLGLARVYHEAQAELSAKCYNNEAGKQLGI